MSEAAFSTDWQLEMAWNQPKSEDKGWMMVVKLDKLVPQYSPEPRVSLQFSLQFACFWPERWNWNPQTIMQIQVEHSTSHRKSDMGVEPKSFISVRWVSYCHVLVDNCETSWFFQLLWWFSYIPILANPPPSFKMAAKKTAHSSQPVTKLLKTVIFQIQVIQGFLSLHFSQQTIIPLWGICQHKHFITGLEQNYLVPVLCDSFPANSHHFTKRPATVLYCWQNEMKSVSLWVGWYNSPRGHPHTLLCSKQTFSGHFNWKPVF